MKQQTIPLGKYPYTYARVSVMRSALLSKDDYHRLMKMSLNEIISFLQSSEYRKDIDELAVKYSGVELMETALNRNLVSTWNKLRRISSKDVGLLIDAYLERADLWNIKTILRGLHTGTSAETVADMLLPAGRLGRAQLEDMAKSESTEEFLKKLEAVGIKNQAMAHGLEELREKNTIVEIENTLDRTYHERMLEFSKRMPDKGKLFRQFIEAEIEMINTVNILRLKAAGAEKNSIMRHVMGKPTPFIKRLAQAESAEETARLLSQKGVPEQAIQALEKGSVASTEIWLGKSLLNRTRLLLHQHPLTVDVILGYMFAKEIEIKNLKMLLKARQLNLEDQFTEEQIII